MWQSIQYTCIVGHGIPRRPILTDVLWGPLDYSSKKVENYPLGLRKTVSRFLKKIKIELSCDLAVPLLGLYPEKNTV